MSRHEQMLAGLVGLILGYELPLLQVSLVQHDCLHPMQQPLAEKFPLPCVLLLFAHHCPLPLIVAAYPLYAGYPHADINAYADKTFGVRNPDFEECANNTGLADTPLLNCTDMAAAPGDSSGRTCYCPTGYRHDPTKGCVGESAIQCSIVSASVDAIKRFAA